MFCVWMVREAVIALDIRGLVEARHGSGLDVNSLPSQSEAPPELDVGAFELIKARILFEGEARGGDVNPRVDEHQSIVDALRVRDPATARQTMHLHLRRVERGGRAIHQRCVQVARRLGIGPGDAGGRRHDTA